ELGTEPPGSTRTLVVEGDDGQPDLELEPGDQLVYELHEWSEEARRYLDQLLTSFGSTPTMEGAGDAQALGLGLGGRRTAIPHLWQGTDLVVPVELREQAEALIDQVELTTLLALDPEAPKVAYDLSDLDDEQLDQIAEALAAEEIPH